MARFHWIIVVLCVVSALPARGQEISHESSLPIATASDTARAALPANSRVELESPDVFPAPFGREHKIVDKKFLALGLVLGSAMTFDTYSTFQSLSWCPTCREANPYAEPFVNRGPVAAYSMGVAFDVSVMGAAAAMRKSANPALRKIWWAPAALLIVGHGLAARHNYELQQVCQRNPRCG